MRVISKKAIRAFVKIHPDAIEPLNHWWRITQKATWSSLMDVRDDFGHADAVGKYTVFNVAGNKYRLIASINYRWQVVYIRRILTHAEYDKGGWKL